MRNIVMTILAGTLFISSTSFANVVHHCEPAYESRDIGWIQVSMDALGSNSLAIFWKRPVGREDVEETSAEAVDDFTVWGYYSEGMKASLLFYTGDDVRGERTVLELDGVEIPVVCKSEN